MATYSLQPKFSRELVQPECTLRLFARSVATAKVPSPKMIYHLTAGLSAPSSEPNICCRTKAKEVNNSSA